ncbi:retrovirus-related pol polyprotein from transposon TNT 1-94 [Tanacetum coccineum]
MKDIFEELEAEVDQNVVHRKHAEIERKNLLIANDNLIADCLSKDVFYITTNSELTVSRFTEMHDAHTVVQARCLELEAELSKLRDKIQTDDHNELVNRFSNLEVNHLNLQLKYQNLKESFGNNPPPPAKETPDFDSVFIIGKMKASLQGKDNVIKKLKMQISQLKETRSEADQQNELFRAENGKIKQHYKELYDSIKNICAKHIEQTIDLLTKNENLKVQIHNKMQCVTTNPVKPRVLAPGLNSCTNASGSQPRSNTKKNMILPAKSVNKKIAEEHPGINKSNLKTKNRVDSSISSKRTVINSNSHTACKTVKQVWKPKQVKQVWKPTGKILPTVGYQWMPTGRTFTLGAQCPLTRLTGSKLVSAIAYANPQEPNQNWGSNYPNSPSSNFMKKFIGTIRFGNEHFAAIMGYGDYVIVAFRKHSSYVRDTDGVDLIKGSRDSNLYTISVEDMMKSSPICLLSKAFKNKSWLWHRRLNHLNFGTINDLARKDLVRGLPRLKFEKDHLCSACQLGKSKKHTQKPKTENTNLEVLNTLHMDLCGPMRVPTINGKKYILVIIDDYSRFTWVKFLRSKDETP